jgi:glycosyltransferase involved in cell wall biosynthesis
MRQLNFSYLAIPHTGGAFTVFRSLHAGLAPHGIRVGWLGVGPAAQAAYFDPRWSVEREHGIALGGHVIDDRQQAEELIRFLETSGVDGIFVNVFGDKAQTNAMRYLNPAIRRIMIVHSTSLGTYAAARAVRDCVHATVGVSPRVRCDLVARYGFAEGRTYAIPNAVDRSAFDRPRSSRPSVQPLRVLFLGRIVDEDKGVFWLPKIMERLGSEAVEFHVVGDGRDLPELKRRCSRFGGRIHFWGRVPPEQVPQVCVDSEVILFPSRFEGLGLSLVEAMATGCVPIASHIRGVTDFVVEDGVSGILFPVGSAVAAADAIKRLAGDRVMLRRMSAAAQKSVGGRFALTTMAQAYARVIASVIEAPPPIADRLDLRHWRYPRGLRPSLRSYLPTRLKNFLRGLRERIRT